MSTVVRRRLLSFREAREIVLAAAHPLPPEVVPLAEGRGRALARVLPAPHDLPPFRNSSMDGYAVTTADLAGASATAPVTLPVVEVIPAGRVASRALRGGEAMRIMTGARMPDGANAVVPVEEVARLIENGAERARFARPVREGESVREAGRDLRAGEIPLAEGRELSAYDLALLAALGYSRVSVGSRPRAAILSTGDELIEVDQPLRPGAIRDSNRPMLAMLLEECGARVVSSARTGDDPAEAAARMREALAACDVLLTIGGVSAGDFEPVREGLGALGEVELWHVAMKPGRPQAFGAPGGKLFFGLPGNPASVACVFETLVRPALRCMQGFAALDRPRAAVRAAQAIASRAGRTDFVRVTIEPRGETLWAAPAGEQVSGHLTPQARAHALLIVPDETASLEAGDAAEALILRWPGETPA